MAEISERIMLQDGTLVRHTTLGYRGKIDGRTEIKSCFTKGGTQLSAPNVKESFQYRVVVSGETMRHIAPAEDLEILQQSTPIKCFRCQYVFRTKPGLTDKPGGLCTCGGWICPACWGCEAESTGAQNETSSCPKQRKRLIKKLAAEKKAKSS